MNYTNYNALQNETQAFNFSGYNALNEPVSAEELDPCTLAAKGAKLKDEIDANGHNALRRYPIIDPSLTRYEKCLYALISTYKENCCFPTVATMSRLTGINIVQVRAALKGLERQGYVEIEHRGRKSNLYKIIDLPKKFLEAPTGTEVGFEDAYEKIRTVGLKQYGYGKIPKSIFENKKIPFVAKTIYAVHCVFGGYAQGDRATHPSRRLIMNFLGVCERTYGKHQRILAENGYISAVQRYDGNQFSINNYTLVANPTQSPFPERALAVGKTDDNGRFVISYIKKFGAAVRSVVESVANVAEVITEKVAEAVRPADKTTRKEPVVDLSYLIRYGGDREQVEQVIHRLTNWDINKEWAMKNGTFDDFQQRTYRIANEALVAMCNDDYRLSNGVVIASEKILAKIFEYGENFYTEVIETALYNYQTAVNNGTEIKIPLKYMQSCLWTALQTGDIHTANAIQRDFGGRTGGFQNRKSRRGRL